MCSRYDKKEIDTIIKHNLRYIPKSLHDTYCFLVSRTLRLRGLYSPNRFIGLYKKLIDITGWKDFFSEKNLFLEQGETGLREAFFKFNGIEGRLDRNPPFLNATQLLQFVAFRCSTKIISLDFDEVYWQLKRFERIIILSDLSISAMSLQDEHRDVARLFKKIRLQESNPEIIAMIICATEESIRKLNCCYSDVIVQEPVSNNYSIFYSGSESLYFGCKKKYILDLCQWFVEKIADKSELLWRMAIAFDDFESMYWGFGKEGWLISTDINTPNNSLPLLWYKPENHPYIPPFPRVSSRYYKTTRWNLRSEYWKIINSYNSERL